MGFGDAGRNRPDPVTTQEHGTRMKSFRDVLQSMRDVALQYGADAEFRARVDDDPVAVLREKGIDIASPEKGDVRLYVNDERTMHIVFPPAPGQLGDAKLGQVAGGTHTQFDTFSFDPNQYYGYP